MVINVGMTGKGAGASFGRSDQSVRAFDRSKIDKQTSALMSEYRHQAAKSKADLDSALDALKCANSEIDRLNSRLKDVTSELEKSRIEIGRLEAEIRSEREKSSKKRQQKQQSKPDVEEKPEGDE